MGSHIGQTHKRLKEEGVYTSQSIHGILLEMVATPVTHALLAARLGSRRISSKEDTGTNPSIILPITGRTKPIFQL